MQNVVEIKPVVKNYEWGKDKSTSLVANLMRCETSQKYAELWMGTHHSGHATLINNNQTLHSWIQQDRSKRLGSSFNDLPFLFKVLSIAKPLSIQLHPDKENATKLHNLFPNLYPDENHKPEMVVSLSDDFEALCSFKPIDDLMKIVNLCPELNIFGEIHDASSLKTFVQQMFKCDTTSIINAISTRLMSKHRLTEYEELFLKLHNLFPDDVGCLFAFMMKHVKLNYGESLFISPNVPHAYLYGNCLECMANSDNVVRAGLTTKHKDIVTFCQLMSIETPSDVVKTRFDGCTIYIPTFPDFKVGMQTITQNCLFPQFDTCGPIIVLILDGNISFSVDGIVKNCQKGSSFYLIPKCQVFLQTADISRMCFAYI